MGSITKPLLKLSRYRKNSLIGSVQARGKFYAFSEIVEAIVLVSLKNAFAALFALNALLTLLFGYFLYVVTGNFTEQSVFYIGLIALVFGIVNVLSSYLLSKVKE
jgi:hypothetical protein